MGYGLPWATPTEVYKICKKVIDESGSQPQPSPTPSGFQLNHKFFDLMSGVNFDIIDSESFKKVFIAEMDSAVAAKGYSEFVTIYTSNPADGGEKVSENNVFWLNLIQGMTSSDVTYECEGYLVDDVIDYINGSKDTLDVYVCHIELVMDIESGDSWIVVSAWPVEN